MLLLQARKLRPKLAFFLFVIAALVAPWWRLVRAWSALGAVQAGKWFWIIAFWLTPDKPA